MANSIQSSQIYNHFLTAYAPKEVTRADTHKKDELRGIYNSIVRLSKESPLYLLTNDSAMEADAIGIKESARDLQGTLADLEADAADSIFSKKSAYTTDDTMLNASYIGGDRPLEDVPSFQIEVDKLATQQKNTGNSSTRARRNVNAPNMLFPRWKRRDISPWKKQLSPERNSRPAIKSI